MYRGGYQITHFYKERGKFFMFLMVNNVDTRNGWKFFKMVDINIGVPTFEDGSLRFSKFFKRSRRMKPLSFDK